jgi:hypothetical protein
MWNSTPLDGENFLKNILLLNKNYPNMGGRLTSLEN